MDAGQHQHLGRRQLAGDLAAHVVAVHLGKVAVQHHHVVPVQPRLVQRVGAVGRHVHRHALAPQAAGDGFGDPGFVFGDEHAHEASG